MFNQRPTVGRIVHYRMKTQGTVVPAVVTMTATEYDAAKAGGATPAITAETNVHLCIFGPVNTYREFNIPQGVEPGQWDWPRLS